MLPELRLLALPSPTDLALAPDDARGSDDLAELRELVDRCCAGEQAAMMALVERFQGRVFGLCLRMLDQRQDAEDITQETFVRALRGLAGWDRRRPFEPWLLAIAGNRCRTALARRQRSPAPLSLDDPATVPAGDTGSIDQLAEEVALAVGLLREEYRRAFLLFHEQQLSYAQIGEVLDCPVGTVKTWVHRARRELVRALHERGAIECGQTEVRDAVR